VWLHEKAGGDVGWAKGATSADLPPKLSRDQLLSRWDRHTKDCASCKQVTPSISPDMSQDQCSLLVPIHCMTQVCHYEWGISLERCNRCVCQKLASSPHHSWLVLSRCCVCCSALVLCLCLLALVSRCVSPCKVLHRCCLPCFWEADFATLRHQA